MKLCQILEGKFHSNSNGVTDYRALLRKASPQMQDKYKEYIRDIINASYLSARNAMLSVGLTPKDPRYKKIATNAPEVGVDNIYIWKTFARKFVMNALKDPRRGYEMGETLKDIFWDVDHIATFWDDISNQRNSVGEAFDDWDDDLPRKSELDSDARGDRISSIKDSEFSNVYDIINDLDAMGDAKRIYAAIPQRLSTGKRYANLTSELEDIYVGLDDVEAFGDMLSRDPARAFEKYAVSNAAADKWAEETDDENDAADWEERNPYASRGLSKNDF